MLSFNIQHHHFFLKNSPLFNIQNIEKKENNHLTTRAIMTYIREKIRCL